MVQSVLANYPDDSSYIVGVDIWNADDTHPLLAIKDVDIFSNSRCCWSGELPRHTADDQPCTVILASEREEATPQTESKKQVATSHAKPMPRYEVLEVVTQDPVSSTSHKADSDEAVSWMEDINQSTRKGASVLEAELEVERPQSGRTRSRRQKNREGGAVAIDDKHESGIGQKEVKHAPVPVKAPKLSISNELSFSNTERGPDQLGSPLSKFMAANHERTSNKVHVYDIGILSSV